MMVFAVMGGLMTSVSKADVVFDLEDVVVTPGSQAVVGVFAYATAGEGLDGFNFPVEIGANGRGFTAGIVGFSLPDFAQEVGVNAAVTTNTNPILIPGFVQNYEAIFNHGANPRLVLPTIANPLRLFNILVDTNGAFSGTTPVSITSSGSTQNPLTVTTSAGFFTAPGAGGFQLVGGSITAVPEPSSIAMLGLAAIGAVAFRRYRKGSLASRVA